MQLLVVDGFSLAFALPSLHLYYYRNESSLNMHRLHLYQCFRHPFKLNMKWRWWVNFGAIKTLLCWKSEMKMCVLCTVYTEKLQHPQSNDNAWINMYRKEITFVLSFAIEYQSWYRVIWYITMFFCGKKEREWERGRAWVNETFLIYSIHAHIKWFTSNRFCIWLQCYFCRLFLLFAIETLCLLSNKKRCQHFVSISIYVIFLSFRLLLITNIQSAISTEFNHISSQNKSIRLFS